MSKVRSPHKSHWLNGNDIFKNKPILAPENVTLYEKMAVHPLKKGLLTT